MSLTIWLENTRRTFRGARRSRSARRFGPSVRDGYPGKRFEDRIAPAGFTGFLDPDPAPGNHFGATVVHSARATWSSQRRAITRVARVPGRFICSMARPAG